VARAAEEKDRLVARGLGVGDVLVQRAEGLEQVPPALAHEHDHVVVLAAAELAELALHAHQIVVGEDQRLGALVAVVVGDQEGGA
jgi:hypothetical protein